MFSDDTTVCCIDESADAAVARLGGAVDELYEWCLTQAIKISSQKRSSRSLDPALVDLRSRLMGLVL